MSNPSDPDFEGPPGTGLGYGINEIRAVLKAVFDEKGGDTAAIDLASAHPYNCKCEICWWWWKTMGLGDEEDPPFNQAQLDAETYAAAIAMVSEVIGLPDEVWGLHRQNVCNDPCGHGDHAWVADPSNARHYKCANCPAEYHP